MTVKEFIEAHPEAHLDLLTPGGIVYLTAEQAQEAIHGNTTIYAHNGFWEDRVEVPAEEILEQVIASVQPNATEENPIVYHMMTEVKKGEENG